MDINSYFEWSDMQKLAQEFRACLGSSCAVGFKKETCCLEINADLNLSHDDQITPKQARCRLVCNPDWAANPPLAFCSEKWLKRDIDWHAYSDGGLCFVLKAEWNDNVGAVERTEGRDAAAKFAVHYCLRNIRWLLYKHYIGGVIGLDTWHPDWPQWPHNAVAEKLYEKEIKK